MTNCANFANDAPQNDTARSSLSSRKAFAILPDHAPPILSRDVVSEENIALVWPYQSLARRRLFHGLFIRYHRQILHGCKNVNCQTPTCLSYQRRVAKRPFRGFTIRSARILAMCLASQDDSGKSLCPHEPLSLSDVPEEKPMQRISNTSRSSKTAPFNTLDLQSKSAKVTSEPESLSYTARNRHTTPKIHSEKQIIPPEKDPKSFTQNLVDTPAMEMLEQGKTPRFLLRWVPWFDKTRDNSMSKVTNRGDELLTNALRPRSKSSPLSDGRPFQVPASMHGDKSVEAFVSNKQSNTNYDDSDKALSDPHTPMSRPATVSKASCASSISRDSSGYDSQEPAIQTKQQDEFTGSGSIIISSSWETTTPIQGSSSIKFTNASSSEFSEQMIDNDSRAISALRNDHFPTAPQTLRMFNLENVTALVSTIKRIHPRLYDEKCFITLLGRTPTPSRFSSFVHCVPTPREKYIAFGTQSIVSVLGSTDALLKSFLARAEDGSSGYNKSARFPEIVEALRLLREIDHHPSNIISSLWISMGKVHMSTNNLSRHPFLKASKAAKSDWSLIDSYLGQESTNDRALTNREAAHIVKIALASLIALYPTYDPDVWFMYRKLRAAGTNVSKRFQDYNDGELPVLLLELKDVFDDEMALNLVTRLVRAVTARRCVSKMSKYQDKGAAEDERSRVHDHDFMDLVIQEILAEDSWDLISALLINQEPLTQDIFGDPSVFPTTTIEKWDERDGRHLRVAIIAEWLRSAILKEWDGKAEISRWSAVGSALEFMAALYRLSEPFEIDPTVFYNIALSERLEVMDMPMEWLNSHHDQNTVHLLSYPFLFKPADLVSFYRAINHAAMFKAFEGSMIAAKLEAQMTFVDPNTGRGELRLQHRLKTATSNYIVLVIRREDVLTDALNQLWRRERRELMRPLKVRMGMDEGEEGVDHGGVQQEFFRVALSESMKPDYGLFTTDPQTQVSWFQPCSLEPLYKFELLGLLTSLAVYNGLTLPVTFPLALYRKLLDLPVTELQHIEDGWPSLAKGLKELLTWEDHEDGMEVEDVFVRSYVFSVEAPGRTIFVDMEKAGRGEDWPHFQESVRNHEPESPEDETNRISSLLSSSLQRCSTSSAPSYDGSCGWTAMEAPHEPTITDDKQNLSRSRTDSATSQARMVTKTNRDQYVGDYIFWLTDKSVRPQYEAFSRGFYTCLDRKATTIFSPKILKRLVEGIQEIDLKELKNTARYEGGYYKEHPTIIDFWSVVDELSTEDLRRLLEFVTASDRIPVAGIANLLFVVQKNGTQDERLPTSLTCFGRLLLPEYSSREKLKEKLCIAIENSKGFGVA